jgi:hypothetical protein
MDHTKEIAELKTLLIDANAKLQYIEAVLFQLANHVNTVDHNLQAFHTLENIARGNADLYRQEKNR